MIKKYNVHIKVICVFLYAFMILFLQSCVSAKGKSVKKSEKYEWKIVKEDKNSEPTWKIYKRKFKGTNFLEYKIEGSIQSSPEDCLEAFKDDMYRLAEGGESKKYPTYEISDESEDGLLTYVIHNEPFPFKDTEMSVRYSFFSKEDGTTGVKWQEAWEDSKIQSSKKLKRVETFRGTWSFSPVTKNSCKAMNSVQFDPKGMPIWLVQPMVSKFLKKGLEKLRTSSSN